MKVFLGGTTNSSKWRDEIIPHLKIEFFNPVVDDWTKEHQDEEIKQRKACSHVLYVITPRMRGLLSICELIDDSNKRAQTTIFCFIPNDLNDEGHSVKFTKEAEESLEVVARIAEANGAIRLHSLADVVNHFNNLQ